MFWIVLLFSPIWVPFWLAWQVIGWVVVIPMWFIFCVVGYWPIQWARAQFTPCPADIQSAGSAHIFRKWMHLFHDRAAAEAAAREIPKEEARRAKVWRENAQRFLQGLRTAALARLAKAKQHLDPQGALVAWSALQQIHTSTPGEIKFRDLMPLRLRYLADILLDRPRWAYCFRSEEEAIDHARRIGWTVGKEYSEPPEDTDWPGIFLPIATDQAGRVWRIRDALGGHDCADDGKQYGLHTWSNEEDERVGDQLAYWVGPTETLDWGMRRW